MKMLWTTLRMFLGLTLLTGILYPLLITVFAQLGFNSKANGSFVKVQEKTLGSELIGQKFTDPKYFWGRPSAVDYNPLPSGGSNLGPTSKVLKAAIEQRKAAFGNSKNVPLDLLFASGSGLDPHITPNAAAFQIPRIAKNRNISEAELAQLIEKHTTGRSLGFLGEPHVNVLNLNLALDQWSSKK